MSVSAASVNQLYYYHESECESNHASMSTSFIICSNKSVFSGLLLINSFNGLEVEAVAVKAVAVAEGLPLFTLALGDEDLGAGYCCTGLMESLDMSLDNIEG